MEFLVDQARFLAALTLAQSVTDRRASMPVLANVLLSVSEDGLTCCATDTTIALSETVPVETRAAGSLTIGVRHLLGIIKTLPAGPIKIAALENHRAQIVSGRSEFQLMGLPESEFPTLPRVESDHLIEIESARLSSLIQKTLFSVSTDEARVNLNGALFESSSGQSTMVSTDGHRLTKFSLPILHDQLDSERRLIIPRKGLTEVKRVLDRAGKTCKIAALDQHLFIETDDISMSVKLSEVKFPPYSQVIPKSFDRVATVPRADFINALRRAEILAPEKTATVRLELGENMLELTADNPDLGVANQQLEVDYDAAKLVAGFNARYLLDALEALDTDYARLEFQGELDPCVIRPDLRPNGAPKDDAEESSKGDDDDAASDHEFLAVVMPMRI